MTISTGVYVETRVRTAVHLTDVILGSFGTILAHLGLSQASLNADWDVLEAGLKTWIAEGSLGEVRLECGDPRYPVAVFRVPIEYRVSSEGDIAFVTSQARIARSLAKLESAPAGTSYRVVVKYAGTHTHVDGWTSTTLADTSGMSMYALGGLGSGPDAGASLSYYSRGG